MLIVVALALGYFGWRQRVEAKAHGLLAQAMAVQDARVGPPPAPGTPAAGLYFPTERERSQAALTKFKIAADAYPSTDAGIYARYQEGATSLALGAIPGAIAAYEQVIKRGRRRLLRPDGAASASPKRRRAPGSTTPRSTPSRSSRSARTAPCRSTAS